MMLNVCSLWLTSTNRFEVRIWKDYKFVRSKREMEMENVVV